jgi:hypothetical protein
VQTAATSNLIFVTSARTIRPVPIDGNTFRLRYQPDITGFQSRTQHCDFDIYFRSSLQ